MKLFKYAVLLVTLSTLFLVGCSSNKEEATTVEESNEPEIKGYNPLSGEPLYDIALLNERPKAVMINNLKAQMPQYGIGNAEVVYEVLAEGEITRLMAFFYDPYNIEKIGSVRSARKYFLNISEAYDAILFHFGASEEGRNYIAEKNLDTFDGMAYDGTLYYRDEERKQAFGSEHSAFTSGALMKEYIEKEDERTEVASNMYPVFNFSEEKVTPADQKAVKVDVTHSKNYFSDFTFDESTGLYSKTQFGEPHIDGNTQEQLKFENIFVLQADFSTYDGGKYTMRSVDLTGAGEGYYISNNGMQKISWERESDDQPFKYLDANGEELKVNVGKSYIGIVENLNEQVQIDEVLETETTEETTEQ